MSRRTAVLFGAADRRGSGPAATKLARARPQFCALFEQAADNELVAGMIAFAPMAERASRALRH
jgi:hypothetical protein